MVQKLFNNFPHRVCYNRPQEQTPLNIRIDIKMCTVIKLFSTDAPIKYSTRNVDQQSGLFMNLGNQN
jgi:hypothetical protein